MGLTLLGAAAPAQAAEGAVGACLRTAAKYPGGVLVFSDGRTTQSILDAMTAEFWRLGRRMCAIKSSDLTVPRVAQIWAELPADQRTDAVLVGVKGTAAQADALLDGPGIHTLIGSSDSGVSRTISWPWRVSGATVAQRFQSRLGELPTYAGGFSGTSDSWLLRSSSSQCAKAAASPNGILIIGDSITYRDFDGIRSWFSSHGWIPCVYAQRSGRVTDLLRQLRRFDVPVPKSVVVALGNNDIFTTKNYRYQLVRMRSYLGYGTNMVLTTIWRTKKTSLLAPLQYNCKVVNRITLDYDKLTSNTTTVDWYSVALSHPGWLYDGIHLTRNGADRRYQMFDAAARALLVTNPAA